MQFNLVLPDWAFIYSQLGDLLNSLASIFKWFPNKKFVEGGEDPWLVPLLGFDLMWRRDALLNGLLSHDRLPNWLLSHDRLLSAPPRGRFLRDPLLWLRSSCWIGWTDSYLFGPSVKDSSPTTDEWSGARLGRDHLNSRYVFSSLCRRGHRISVTSRLALHNFSRTLHNVYLQPLFDEWPLRWVWVDGKWRSCEYFVMFCNQCGQI